MNFKDEIKKLADVYQQQIDAYEKEQQLPWMWEVCCNSTKVSLAKQFVENLNTLLSTCK
jgi:hypothetical protein